MSPRRLLCALSLSSLGLASFACDGAEPFGADGAPQAAASPTGLVCEDIESATMCPDGESRAYCTDFADGSVEYGPCLLPEDIECEPGDYKSVPIPGADPNDPIACTADHYWCVLDEVGVPRWEYQPCVTPLVLDFDASTPIEMHAAESTPMASFDINADQSSCLATDWPHAATPWLVLDRDGNGSIDSGRELFGSGTRLASGQPAAHGFAALAELDANADGILDARDPAFAELMLWRDHDADRQSSLAELEPLAAAGVDSLALEFEVRRECDARGNCGIQRSSFAFDGGRRGELVDLYLACQ